MNIISYAIFIVLPKVLTMDESPLLNMKTKELNKFLNGLVSEDEKKKIKKTLRTCKNRGYALNCRTKRLCHINDLEVANIELKKKLAEGCKDRLDLHIASVGLVPTMTSSLASEPTETLKNISTRFLPNLNLSESQLLDMPLPKLSHILQGFSECEIKNIMEKRRILKNRAAAHRSRLKLLTRKKKLEVENMNLKKTLNHLNMVSTQSETILQSQKSILKSNIIIGQNNNEEINKIQKEQVDCHFCRDVFGNHAHEDFVHNVGCYIP